MIDGGSGVGFPKSGEKSTPSIFRRRKEWKKLGGGWEKMLSLLLVDIKTVS